MAVTLEQVEGLTGADVFDEKGVLVGTVQSPHVLDGELVGLVVRLDRPLAELPGVGRDEIEIGADRLQVTGRDSVRFLASSRELIAHAAGRAATDEAGRERRGGF